MSDQATTSAVLAAARREAARAFSATTGPSRGAVWWASVIALVAVGTIAGAFVYSYFYLRLGAQQWPPPRTELRPIGGPLLAGGAVTAALAIGRRTTIGGARAALAGALAAAGLVIQVVALLRAPDRIDANAYEALVVSIDVLAATLLGVAVGLRGATVIVGGARRGPSALREADTATFTGAASIWGALWMVLHIAPRVL